MIKHRWLLVWLVAFAINSTSHALFELNSSLSLDLKSVILNAFTQEQVTDLSKGREYRLRVYWEASVLASLVAYLAACFWGIQTYFQCVGTTLRHPIMVMGVGTIAFELFRIGTSGEDSAIFNTIFCTTYEALGHSPYVTADFMAGITFLIKLINVLAIFSPSILVMGISAILTLPDAEAKPSLDLLIERDGTIDRSALIGSFMMLMALVHMGCWMDWPIGVWSDSDLKTTIMALTASVYEYWGISFSIMLLLVYAAAKWAWKLAVIDMLSINHPNIDPHLFIADHNLGFRIRRHLPHALAIALPFLSSLIGSGSNIFAMH